MIAGLLWIIGIYGLGIAFVHLYEAVSRRPKVNTRIILLITNHNETHIEWYIRCLFFFSRLRNKPLEIFVYDEGSTDDTLMIVERLARNNRIPVRMIVPTGTLHEWIKEHEEDSVIVVKVNSRIKAEQLAVYL